MWTVIFCYCIINVYYFKSRKREIVMAKDRNSFQREERNLIDVFNELQELQHNPKARQAYQRKVHKSRFSFHSKLDSNKTFKKSYDLKLSHIIVGCSALIIGMAIFFPKTSAFTESYAKEENLQEVSEYELNRHRLNMQSIISENSGMDRVKEQVTEERDVDFETTYQNNSTLPKGEEIILQEGTLGKDNVTVVKTYENGNFVEEVILSKDRLVEPVSKIIDVGTSEFLAKHKVHIGDIMYFVNNATLKEAADDNSNDVAEVKESLDVKLLELPSEEWCKVSFDGIEGYIKTSNLTSSYTTPNIVEKNRIQRILIKVNIDMELNKTSGLTLNDYKKVFTNLPNDTNNIFEDNYAVFYNMEKKYNINGIFLASMAIHESAWGTSQIAKDKHNLFGYGAYDESPYELSLGFDSYAEGIETVAKSLVKYYLNPSGTKIYDGETAAAWYYNGPTLQGVNTRYASDKEWYTKVYSYMEMLYNRLS